VPGAVCEIFPARDDELPAFLDRLARLFDRRQLTAEDAERTEMYRRRLVAQPPAEGDGLRGFLTDLGMVLTLRDRSAGDWTRAHQLINKTNQFNLNGVRLERDEMAAILAGGGQLLTATLEDRTGSHGEILACLIDASGRVCSLVMSCRVFRRRLEFAFMAWLLNRWRGPALTLAFISTPRNEPARTFFADPAFTAESDTLSVDRARFLDEHREDLSLFTIREDKL
jgi:FkbH-like protein